MRYTHAHASYGESGQQQNYFDGYTRYNHAQQHNHHHGSYPGSFNGHYGAMRENYPAGAEGSGQYYYQNAHQTSAGYYGNPSYDSYRNATTGYQYNHYGSAGYHQSTPHPSPYYSSYNNSPTDQFNNRYYPTPPPSAPPQASQRDPYSMVHPQGEGATQSSYASPIESESKEKRARLSIDNEKSTLNDSIASSPSSPLTVKQSNESANNVDNERRPEVQQTEQESPSPHEVTPSVENEKPNEEGASENVKVDRHLGSDEKEQKTIKHENQHHQSTSHFHENGDHNQQSQCNEILTKASGANSQEAMAGNEVENPAATGKRKTRNTFPRSFRFPPEVMKEEEKKNCFVFISLSPLFCVAQLSCGTWQLNASRFPC